MLKIAGFNGKFGEEEVSRSVVKQPEPKGQKQEKRIPDSERVRPDASFKIKDSLRQISQTQSAVKVKIVTEKQVQVESREPLNELLVTAALEKYVTDYRPDPTIAIALKTHHPEIDKEKIIISVDNQLQLEKLETMKAHLQNALMKTLNNGFVILTFKMFDAGTAKEEKKLFTAGEKFEHFLKLNPVVADLKNIFGLELE